MKVSHADEAVLCLHKHRHGYMAPDLYEREPRKRGGKREYGAVWA